LRIGRAVAALGQQETFSAFSSLQKKTPGTGRGSQ
jgi:hypothetical protein